MVRLGKLLQLIAMVMLPLAMFLEINKSLAKEFYLADMTLMLLFGVVLFGLGRVIEGYGQAGRP
ncbi:MAG: hypothetical protein ABGX07_07105 [Pirellulaceae bacterium]|nr:hypothetical protein [Planctomycetaceae bacterium]HIM28684.1 hypothetical protein [Planctomycetota bacterium]